MSIKRVFKVKFCGVEKKVVATDAHEAEKIAASIWPRSYAFHAGHYRDRRSRRLKIKRIGTLTR